MKVDSVEAHYYSGTIVEINGDKVGVVVSCNNGKCQVGLMKVKICECCKHREFESEIVEVDIKDLRPATMAGLFFPKDLNEATKEKLNFQIAEIWLDK